jgi:hypothetical protein
LVINSIKKSMPDKPLGRYNLLQVPIIGVLAVFLPVAGNLATAA